MIGSCKKISTQKTIVNNGRSEYILTCDPFIILSIGYVRSSVHGRLFKMRNMQKILVNKHTNKVSILSI